MSLTDSLIFYVKLKKHRDFLLANHSLGACWPEIEAVDRIMEDIEDIDFELNEPLTENDIMTIKAHYPD